MTKTYEYEVIRRYWDMDPTVTREDALKAAEKLGWDTLREEEF